MAKARAHCWDTRPVSGWTMPSFPSEWLAPPQTWTPCVLGQCPLLPWSFLSSCQEQKWGRNYSAHQAHLSQTHSHISGSEHTCLSINTSLISVNCVWHQGGRSLAESPLAQAPAPLSGASVACLGAWVPTALSPTDATDSLGECSDQAPPGSATCHEVVDFQEPWFSKPRGALIRAHPHPDLEREAGWGRVGSRDPSLNTRTWGWRASPCLLSPCSQAAVCFTCVWVTMCTNSHCAVVFRKQPQEKSWAGHGTHGSHGQPSPDPAQEVHPGHCQGVQPPCTSLHLHSLSPLLLSLPLSLPLIPSLFFFPRSHSYLPPLSLSLSFWEGLGSGQGRAWHSKAARRSCAPGAAEVPVCSQRCPENSLLGCEPWACQASGTDGLNPTAAAQHSGTRAAQHSGTRAAGAMASMWGQRECRREFPIPGRPWLTPT